MVRRAVRLIAAVGMASVVLLWSAVPALAHEHRTVGAYQFRVGWKAEPAFTDTDNAVQLFLDDSAGKPVLDLGTTLQVQVLFADQKTAPLALSPAFGPGYGTPGEYDSPIMPTRPGNYTFRFTGAIHGQSVDASFTSSPTTFATVTEATVIEFPAQDPSRAQISEQLGRLDPRLQALQTQMQQTQQQLQRAQDAAAFARDLAVAGVVLGMLGIGAVIVLTVARRRGGQALVREPGRPSAS